MRLSMILGAATVLTLSALPASAQFTSVVVPPPAKPAPVAQTQTQTIAERRDSAARVTMTNMKDWVDSAAATLGVTVAPVDSARPVVEAPTARPELVAPPTPVRPTETTEFREGAKAPNTATPIPLIALLGLLALSAGLVLLRPLSRRRA